MFAFQVFPTSIRIIAVRIVSVCTDLESFVRGGQTLTSFFLICFSLMRGGWIKISLLAGHQRPARDTPFKWGFAGVLMMAQH